MKKIMMNEYEIDVFHSQLLMFSSYWFSPSENLHTTALILFIFLKISVSRLIYNFFVSSSTSIWRFYHALFVFFLFSRNLHKILDETNVQTTQSRWLFISTNCILYNIEFIYTNNGLKFLSNIFFLAFMPLSILFRYKFLVDYYVRMFYVYI